MRYPREMDKDMSIKSPHLCMMNDVQWFCEFIKSNSDLSDRRNRQKMDIHDRQYGEKNP